MEENTNWLPHLSNEMMIGARNNNLCSYVIALEGWRRGLTLKFYSKKVKQNTLHVPGCLFSLSDGNETHMFYKSRGMRVRGEAFTIGGNKYLAKKRLHENGIPVPQGELFDYKTLDEEIIEYAEKIGYPVVLKPSNAAQGKGVIANITDAKFLADSLRYVRKELGYKAVILEEFVSGKEYRVYVMEDEVLAVLNRVPANVIGDGNKSIRQLIAMKNEIRKKNPRLYSCLIKVDFEIKNILNKKGYNLDSIPKENEVVYLREKSNTSSGGDSYIVTEDFPEEIKNIAINALKCISNFPNGGVDIMVDSTLPVGNSAKVIELTPVPQLGSLVFPMYGKACDIPAAIVDYYFPNTKDKRNSNPNVYFSIKDVLAPLNSKSASEVTVTDCPTDIEHQVKYIIKGKVQKVGFRRWIRKKALEHDLYGFAKNNQNGHLIIAVAGTKERVENFLKICERGPAKARVDKVEVEKWSGPVKVGFEIKPNKFIKRKTQKKQQTLHHNKTVANKKIKKSLYQKFKRKIKSILKV